MKAIVYGANGYIGFHLTNTLLQRGHKVLAVIHESRGHLDELVQENLTIISNKDFLDKIETIETIKETDENDVSSYQNGADVFYHLAWAGSCGNERSDALYQLKNVELAVSSLNIAEKINCKKIIYIGTIYENLAEGMLKQSDFNPNVFYVLAKKHAHELTLELSKKLNIKYIWCNLCHPLGKYMPKTQFMPSAIEAFVNNKETFYDSCKTWYDIFSVTTLSEQLSILGEKDAKANYYFLGSGSPKLSCDYLTEAAGICGYNLEIGFGKRLENPLSFKKEWFSTIEFENEFEYKNTKSFKEVIEEYRNTQKGS